MPGVFVLILKFKTDSDGDFYAVARSKYNATYTNVGSVKKYLNKGMTTGTTQ